MTQRIFLSLTAVVLLAISANAQELGDKINNPRVRERIQAARVAYITERLNLNTKESQQFWAINNEYEAAKRSIKQQYQSGGNLEAMSDAEAEKRLRQQLKMEEELLELKQSYIERFLEVVPARKVVLFQKADKEFRLELLRKVRDRRNKGRRFRN
jgi:hypothetical protein